VYVNTISVLSLSNIFFLSVAANMAPVPDPNQQSEDVTHSAGPDVLQIADSESDSDSDGEGNTGKPADINSQGFVLSRLYFDFWLYSALLFPVRGLRVCALLTKY